MAQLAYTKNLRLFVLSSLKFKKLRQKFSILSLDKFSQLKRIFLKFVRVIMNKKSFISFFKRGFHTSKPLKDMDLNPLPKLSEYASEEHIKPLVPLMWFLLLVAIPGVSIKMWYDEYQHRIVHPKRIKAPKHDFLHHQPRPYTWGDGDKTPLFHPYWNFTKNGYITDKEGNLLPKGTYVDE